MWVVSQDSCILLDANKFVILEDNDKYVIYANDVDVGIYPTLEEAQNQLKMLGYKTPTILTQFE